MVIGCQVEGSAYEQIDHKRLDILSKLPEHSHKPWWSPIVYLQTDFGFYSSI